MHRKWQVHTEDLSSKIDEEPIFMSIAAEYCFGLDSVGRRIWEILSKQVGLLNENSVSSCFNFISHFTLKNWLK